MGRGTVLHSPSIWLSLSLLLSVFSNTSHQASQQCFNSTVFLLGVIWKDEKHSNVLKFRNMLLDTLNLNSFGCTPPYLSLFSSWSSCQRGAVTLALGTCPPGPNMDCAHHISRAIDTLLYIKSSQGVEFHPRVWSIIGRRAGLLRWFALGKGSGRICICDRIGDNHFLFYTFDSYLQILLLIFEA